MDRNGRQQVLLHLAQRGARNRVNPHENAWLFERRDLRAQPLCHGGLIERRWIHDNVGHRHLAPHEIRRRHHSGVKHPLLLEQRLLHLARRLTDDYELRGRPGLRESPAPVDWPRINQFPEWFTARRDSRYDLRTTGRRSSGDSVNGAVLLSGLRTIVPANGSVLVTIGTRP